MLRKTLLTLALTVSQAVSANPVVEMANQYTVGCFQKADLAHLMKNSTIGKVKKKIVSKNCFGIDPGAMAISAPEMQTQEDMWRGIAKMKTKDGREFYTTAWTWRYIATVPRWVSPPR